MLTLLVLTLPPSPLTIPAGAIPLLVLPLWPWSLPSTRLSLVMLPLLVLPMSRLTPVAVGISRRMVLTIPTVGIAGIPPRLLPLPLLTLPARDITPGLLTLSLLPPEHIGVAPRRLRGKGPSTRLTRGGLIRPGQGVWRAEGQDQPHPQDNTQPFLAVHPLILPKINLHIRIC